jgi:hypothetical protein
VAVVVGSLVAASGAAAVRTEFFGIAQQGLDARDAKGMRNAAIRTDRFELGWRLLEPRKGSFDWQRSDQLVGTLASHGIRPFPFIWGSPKWVSSQPAVPPVDNAAHAQAWRTFLEKAASRYGPGGSYWSNGYRQHYGAHATPLPILYWQIWNEPNLTKFFNPGGTARQSVQKYARLLQISHNAIKSKSPGAQIVLAGNPGYPPSGGLKAWEFLDRLYGVPGSRTNFDVAALHPYASTVDEFGIEIEKVRGVMKKHGDAATPLWITEVGWGSAHPDRFGINQGLSGQQRLLKRAYEAVLANRNAWNVQRVYWFLWRDPRADSTFAHRCSFCGSAGLLRNDRTPKPAFQTFKGFTAEKTKPQAKVTSGPAQGSFIRNSRPTFSFVSNEPGSTFECHVGQTAFAPCSSPRTLPHLADGAHTFFVRAIDAPGNVGAIRSRSFTVDTHPPATPKIKGTTPPSPANNNNPKLSGATEPGSTVRIFKTAGCTGPPAATGPASAFRSSGIAVSVPDNSTTSFRARTIDRAGNLSGCSVPYQYVEDSTGP